MNTKKFLAVLLALALVFSLAGCGGKSDGDMPVVGIMQFVQHDALDAATAGFKAALAENGFVEGKTVRFNEQNAQGDTNNCSTIADQFVAENVDLVLTVATPATQAMAGKTADIPILGTAVTDYVVAKLVDSDEAPGGNVTGTSDMNPVEEQIGLLMEFAPNAKKIGIIYTASEDNSALQAKIAKETIEGLGLEPVIVTINNSNDVQQAVQNIVSRCDALYVPTDNTMASAMPIVHSITVEAKIPVIAGESNAVMAGGLATLGINYYNLGYQTGLMAVEILKNGANPATMAVQRAAEFDYVVNGTVAEELGIDIPDYLQEYVEYME